MVAKGYGMGHHYKGLLGGGIYLLMSFYSIQDLECILGAMTIPMLIKVGSYDVS